MEMGRPSPFAINVSSKKFSRFWGVVRINVGGNGAIVKLGSIFVRADRRADRRGDHRVDRRGDE